MAIKGKARAKAKARPRQVTPGPKPVVVPVKPPFLGRRWVQLSLSVLVGIGIVLFATWVRDGLHRESATRADNALKAAERKYVGQFKATIDSAIQSVGQPQPPSAFGYLTDLSAAISGMQKGTTKDADALTAAKGAASTTAAAKKTLDGVDPSNVLGGHGFSQLAVVYGLSAKARMSQALELSGKAASLVEQAAKASGAERDALLASAVSIQDTATRLFNDGYNDYIQLQSIAGIYTPSIQPVQPGIPGGLPGSAPGG